MCGVPCVCCRCSCEARCARARGETRGTRTLNQTGKSNAMSARAADSSSGQTGPARGVAQGGHWWAGWLGGRPRAWRIDQINGIDEKVFLGAENLGGGEFRRSSLFCVAPAQQRRAPRAAQAHAARTAAHPPPKPRPAMIALLPDPILLKAARAGVSLGPAPHTRRAGRPPPTLDRSR